MLINPLSYVSVLSVIVAARGPLPTVRVSSAKSSAPYSYWGAARGEIRARKRDGVLTCVSTEQSSSDRRARHLAKSDAENLARREARIVCQDLGTVSERMAAKILSDIGC